MSADSAAAATAAISPILGNATKTIAENDIGPISAIERVMTATAGTGCTRPDRPKTSTTTRTIAENQIIADSTCQRVVA